MTIKLKCPVCNSEGTLMQKKTKTKTTRGEYKDYTYWYIYHGKKAKRQWCYLNNKLLEIPKLKNLTEKIKQITTQIGTNVPQTHNPSNSLNPNFIHQNNKSKKRGCPSLVKGDRLRTCWRRPAWVQSPHPAPEENTFADRIFEVEKLKKLG